MNKKHKNKFFSRYECPPTPQTRHSPRLAGCVPGGIYTLSKNIFLCFLYAIIFFLPSKVYATLAGEVNKANGLYKQGKFDDSLDLYQKAMDQDSKSPVVKYDLGTDLYKKGDYDKARGYLEQAANDKNIKIRSRAEYNLGNVLYKSGKQKENSNVDQAVKSMESALGQYVKSLTDVPNDLDAKFNEDFVKKEIERLKQKKQQQKDQQQNQKQQQNQQQNQQNKQDQQDQKNQQNQQNQSGQQDQQQNKQNQQKQQGSQQQQNREEQAQQDQKELDRKQAQDLLEDYQENQEPKKLLNYMPKKIDERPVLKDW